MAHRCFLLRAGAADSRYTTILVVSPASCQNHTLIAAGRLVAVRLKPAGVLLQKAAGQRPNGSARRPGLLCGLFTRAAGAAARPQRTCRTSLPRKWRDWLKRCASA